MVQFHERIFFLWPPSQKLARLWHCTAMQILGVTGGIGSGKSTFCSVFKELGIPVIDADILSREALQPGNPCYYKVIRTFGPFLGASLYLGTETALTEGVPMENSPLLDRVKLGELVFKNTELKKALESIVHPFVRRQIILQLLKYFICGYSLVILEVPLLFETGLHRYCSKTLLVCCSKEAQLRRILERNRELNLDQVRDRIESQWPTEMKKDLADFIIDNSIDRKRCRVDGKDESSTEFNSHGSEEERDETSTELDKFSLRECKNILTLLQRQQPCINWQWWSLVAFPFTTVAYCVLKKFEK